MSSTPEETLEQFRKEVSESAETIKNNVYHTYPYSQMLGGFQADAPHSDDCIGCIVNVEVDKLVGMLDGLADTVKIRAQLEEAEKELRDFRFEKHQAFNKAGIKQGESVSELVGTLVNERNDLTEKLGQMKAELKIIISMY